MKRLFQYTIGALSVCTLAASLVSSNTDVEAVKVVSPNIEQQNPQLYAQYLTNLRAYKNSDHQVVITYFDNSAKVSTNQSQRISALPDSIDYVCLSAPQNLSDLEKKEMKEAQTKKGTKFMYSIDFDAIKLVYDTRKADFYAVPDNKKKPYMELNTFLVDSVQTALSYYDKNVFDAIVFAYNGKQKHYMSKEEKNMFTGYENDFIGMATHWLERNPSVKYMFQGKPQNVMNQQIFEKVSYIILPCLNIKSVSELPYTAQMAIEEGIPTNKFIPMVQTTSLDKADVKTGYLSSKLTAIEGAAKWVASYHTEYSVVGLAIYNASTDYFNPLLTYPNVRKAIATINPNI